MRTVVCSVLIAWAGWFVYAPVLHGNWLWDDDRYITQNLQISGQDGLAKIWLEPVDVNYFPVTSTVQWVQWRMWKDHTFGYHVTNVALHVVSALLLWRLLSRIGVRCAWLGGLLWVVHPLAVESVAWISELKNTLSLPFLLLAAIAFVEFDDGRGTAFPRRPVWYALSLGFFILAMLSKSLVVMFPAALLLYCGWKRGKITAADVRTSAPFFAVSLVLGVVTLVFEYKAIGAGGAALGGPLSRLACAGLAIAFYVWKTVLPFGLLPIYPRWTVNPPTAAEFAPWLVLGALLWLFWQKRATWGRHALLGAGFFLLNLAPVLGLVPMAYQRISWVADHFAYTALVGAVGLAAAGMGMLQSGLFRGDSRPILAGAATLCALLAVQSRSYAGIYKDEKTLWTFTLQHNPDAWMAHVNLGVELMKEGDAPAALGQFTEAVRLDPASPEAHTNRGIALANLNRLPEAVSEAEEAVRLAPDFGPGRAKLGEIRVRAADAFFNQANALAQSSRWDEAAAQYERALELRPDFPEAQANLGNALFSLHRLPEAVEHYRAALRLKADYADAHYNLGIALQALGQTEDAASQFEQAGRPRPESP